MVATGPTVGGMPLGWAVPAPTGRPPCKTVTEIRDSGVSPSAHTRQVVGRVLGMAMGEGEWRGPWEL